MDSKKESNASKTSAECEEDEDLDTLLDEALMDFKSRETKKSNSSNQTPAADQIDSDEDSDGTRIPTRIAAAAAAAAAAGGGDADLQTPPNSFVDPSAFKQAFEKHYKEMQHKFPADRADSATAAAAASDAEGRPLQEALRAMRAGIPGQQQRPNTANTSSTDQMTEEELDKLFDEMRLGPPPIGGGGDSLLPMMETMMQSLLSKDLLYPAIRDLADKYPGWLEKEKGGGDLAPDQLEKFKRQYEISKQICQAYESDEAKTSQFQRIMSLMQEMQSLGNPPPELVGGGGGLDDPLLRPEFDAYGNPVLPDQCKVS